jgi:hypothetical protein
MVTAAISDLFENWNMVSDCKISSHTLRLPHNMAVKN